MRENCNNLCKEVGIVRSKPARWTIFARRERHREGFENVRVSQKNKGAHLHRTLKTKRVGGEFRTREESEPKSREGGARTREFGNLGGVGTRSCRSQNKGRVRTKGGGIQNKGGGGGGLHLGIGGLDR